MDFPRRHRRLLRPRARQPRPAAPHRHAVPVRPGLPGRNSSTAACSRAPRCRFSSATCSTRSRPAAWPSAPAARTSARCRTASTRCRSSPTCSSSCCRRRRWPPRRAPPIPRASRGRRAWSPRSAPASSSWPPRPFAERVRKATPRAALLSTLSGIAIGFISFGFLFRAFARPIVGLTTFGVVMLTYFGRVRFKGHLPGGLVAIGLGNRAVVGGRHRAGRRYAAGARLSRAGSGRRRHHRRARRRASALLSVGDRRDGALQRAGLAAEHRVGRSGGRRVRDASVADDQRPGQHRGGAVRISVSDDDLHRPSRVEGAWARARAIP